MKKIYLLILVFLPLLILSAEKNNAQEKSKKEIDLLKKNHANEIALYEEKINSLMIQIGQQNTMIQQQNATIQEMKPHLRWKVRAKFVDK